MSTLKYDRCLSSEMWLCSSIFLKRYAKSYVCMWNRSGVQNRRNSFEDGVQGTTCPIPPGRNFTYMLQMKDQIGSFFYFPSLGFQKAAGGFGAIKILSRPLIPVPFDPPADDFALLIGDWYKTNHTVSLSHYLSIYLSYYEYEVKSRKC